MSRRLQQLAQDVLHVLAHVPGLGQRGGVAQHQRHVHQKEKKEAEVKLEEKNKKRKTISLATIAAVGTSLVQAMSPAKKGKREP